MKWVLILLVLAVVGAVLYLRTVRDQPAATDADDPHRLDDSISDSTPEDDPPA